MTASAAAQNTPKDAVRGSALLLAGRVFSMAINTAYQVVLVRSLSKSDFGVLAYGLSLASTIQIIVSLGQERSISRFIVFYEEDERPDRVLGTLVLYVGTVALLGLVALGLVVGFSHLFVDGLDHDSAAAVLAILALLAPLNSLDMMMQSTFAAFDQTRSIFLKRYIINPLIRFGAVVAASAGGLSLEAIATILVGAATLGILVYAVALPGHLRERGLLRRPLRDSTELPVSDVLRFSMPLMTSPMVWVSFGLGTATILAWQFDSTAVAEYRAVIPIARLNLIVSSTFSLLFLPTLARSVARRLDAEVNAAYWRTSAWVATLTMPPMLLTIPLADDTTSILFDDYGSSVSVLAIVGIGMYCDVVFGFNRQTLELYGKIPWVLGSDAITVLLHIPLCIVLTSEYGITGAAVATTVALIARNLLNQIVVARLTPVDWFEWRYAGVYASVVGGAAIVWVTDLVIGPMIVGYAVAGLATLATLVINRRTLEVVDTFPETRRIPVLGTLLS